MIKVAQALATFTNNANTKMHEALEYFEEKVIEAFEYGEVCYLGVGKRRKRRDTAKSENTLGMVDDKDIMKQIKDMIAMEQIQELEKSLREAAAAKDVDKFNLVSVTNIE